MIFKNKTCKEELFSHKMISKNLLRETKHCYVLLKSWLWFAHDLPWHHRFFRREKKIRRTCMVRCVLISASILSYSVLSLNMRNLTQSVWKVCILYTTENIHFTTKRFKYNTHFSRNWLYDQMIKIFLGCEIGYYAENSLPV